MTVNVTSTASVVPELTGLIRDAIVHACDTPTRLALARVDRAFRGAVDQQWNAAAFALPVVPGKPSTPAHWRDLCRLEATVAHLLRHGGSHARIGWEHGPARIVALQLAGLAGTHEGEAILPALVRLGLYHAAADYLARFPARSAHGACDLPNQIDVSGRAEASERALSHLYRDAIADPHLVPLLGALFGSLRAHAPDRWAAHTDTCQPSRVLFRAWAQAYGQGLAPRPARMALVEMVCDALEANDCAPLDLWLSTGQDQQAAARTEILHVFAHRWHAGAPAVLSWLLHHGLIGNPWKLDARAKAVLADVLPGLGGAAQAAFAAARDHFGESWLHLNPSLARTCTPLGLTPFTPDRRIGRSCLGKHPEEASALLDSVADVPWPPGFEPLRTGGNALSFWPSDGPDNAHLGVDLVLCAAWAGDARCATWAFNALSRVIFPNVPSPVASPGPPALAVALARRHFHVAEALLQAGARPKGPTAVGLMERATHLSDAALRALLALEPPPIPADPAALHRLCDLDLRAPLAGQEDQPWLSMLVRQERLAAARLAHPAWSATLDPIDVLTAWLWQGGAFASLGQALPDVTGPEPWTLSQRSRVLGVEPVGSLPTPQPPSRQERPVGSLLMLSLGSTRGRLLPAEFLAHPQARLVGDELAQVTSLLRDVDIARHVDWSDAQLAALFESGLDPNLRDACHGRTLLHFGTAERRALLRAAGTQALPDLFGAWPQA